MDDVFGVLRNGSARCGIAVLALAGIFPGCATDSECTDPKLVGALEFGVLDQNDQFVPIADGDVVGVINIQATFGLAPSLRARELDPSAPLPNIEVWVDGVLIGANRAGETSDMVPNGDAYVLQNLGVLFQVEPCCFNCLEARIEGDLVDKNCHKCSGSVTVTLAASGGVCPPTTHCGCAPNTCAAPLAPTACAE